MKSISEVSSALKSALSDPNAPKLTQQALRTSAGISRQTLANVLKGTEDYRLSTLLSLADRLGLELLLVPKEAARGLAPLPGERVVQSLVGSIRSRLDATAPRQGTERKNER